MDNFERLIRQECLLEKQYDEDADYEAVEIAEKAIAIMFSSESVSISYKTRRYLKDESR